MKNRVIMLLTVFIVLYIGFNLPSCESDVEQIALTDEHIINAMALAAPIKNIVQKYYRQNRFLPTSNKEVGIQPPKNISNKVVRSIRVYGGNIIIRFNKNILNGDGFQLKPSFVRDASGDIEWTCETGNIEQKYFYNVEPPCLYTASENMEDLINGIHRKDYDMVEEALHAGADINREVFGETPLMKAISVGKPEMVKYLIEQGADIELSSSYYGSRTPLMFAVRNSKLSIVIVLVDNGADVNAQQDDGKSVIEFVQFNGEIKKYLYENGAEGGPEDTRIDTF